MVRVRSLTTILVVICWIAPLAGQVTSAESEKELSVGKQLFDGHKFDDAIRHFKKASKIENQSCFACLIWLIRAQTAAGALKDALKNTDRALLLAQNGTDRATVQLYRGTIFFRMSSNGKGKLVDAEAALRDAAREDPHCSECRFELGFVLLRSGKDADGAEELKAVLPDYRNSPQEREIRRLLADPSRARKNLAPEFAARLSNGEEVDLRKLQGKVVLLDFWGVWCRHCIEMLPALKRLSEKADPAKVMIISIDEHDSPKKWAQFVAKNGMTWPQIYDETGILAQTYGVTSYPHYFLISTDGIVLMDGWRINRQEDALRKAIEAELKDQCHGQPPSPE